MSGVNRATFKGLAGTESRSAIKRCALEYAALFGIAIVLQAVISLPADIAAATPHPYWIPVAVFAVQYGLPGGLAAALVASILLYVPGIPEAAINQSVFEYQAALLLQPALWFVGAAVLGLLASRRLWRLRAVTRQLAGSRDNAHLLAEALNASVSKSKQLERRIAAEASAIGSLLRMAPRLRNGSLEEMLIDMAPFLASLTHAVDIVVYEYKNSLFDPIAGSQDSAPEVSLDASGAIVFADDESPVCVSRIQGGVDAPLHGLVVVQSLQSRANARLSQVQLDKACQGLGSWLDATLSPEHPLLGRRRTLQRISTRQRGSRCQPKYRIVSGGD